MRRMLAVVAALAMLGTTVALAEDHFPPLEPDGVYARPDYATIVPDPGTLQAGAANGDISPPFGTPMTGFYVARHCGLSMPAQMGAEGVQMLEQIQQDPTQAPYTTACLGPKLGPDTDLYAKTFPQAEGRYGRLRANAFVLSDGTTKVALVSVDLPGFFGEMHQAVAHRIADLGIPRENLLVSASHTHTGPGGYFAQNLGWAAVGGDQFDPRIFDAITGGIADAIRRAHDALRPAALASGSVEVDGLNGNRRSSQRALNPEAIAGMDPANAPRIGMIRIDGIAPATPIGAITVFSSHGTIGGTTNLWLTGDDKGWVTRLVEQSLGEGAVVTSLNGAQGDIGSASSDTGWPGNAWGEVPSILTQLVRMEGAGRRQAPHQIALWESLEDALTGDVSLDARLDSVCFCGQEIAEDPYDPFDREPWEPANDDPMYRHVGHVGIIGMEDQPFPTTVFPSQHRKSPLLIGPMGLSPKNVLVQVMRVGDVALATMPGEPTITIGRRIERSVKAALNGDTPDALVKEVWTTGLANDHNAYMSTPQEYESYEYEGSWSMFGPQTGNALKRRLVDLAEWMALAQPVPECTLLRDCMHNPDVSALALEPTPLIPDLGAGEILAQPSDVERFQATSFSWTGGSPSAEFSPGEAMVTLERAEEPDWVAVATDIDQALPMRYAKRYGEHRYTVLFDPTVEWPTGTYRFRVNGFSATAPAARAPYELVSATFEVTVSTGLRLVRQGETTTFDIEHPVPDSLTNYRWRARHAQEAAGWLDGAPAFVGSVDLDPGQELVIAAGGLVDAYGNTNGTPITVVG